MLKKLWNGDYSLGKTFWLFDFLIGNVLSTVVLLMFAIYQCPISIMIAIHVVVICYAIFINISLWRVANKYHGKAIWIKLVKTYVVFCFATAILHYAKLSCCEIAWSIKCISTTL